MMPAVAELPLYVAVTVAVWLPEIAPVVALKVAVDEPVATVTDAGTVSAVALLDKATLTPLPGAAWLSVTVQALEAFCPRVDGLQASEVTCRATTRLTLAVAEEAPRVAFRVAV